MKTLLLTLLLVLPVQGQVTRPVQTIDLNTATRSQLLALDPIVTSEIADAIIKGRPYKTFHEVAAQVPKEVYEGIKFKLLVGTKVGSVPFEREPANERELVKRSIQVIQGNKLDKLIFERKAAEAPSDKPNAPQ